jgi:hypothetical protein
LWSLGYISVQSRAKGRAIRQLGDVQAELVRAQNGLQQLTRVTAEMQAQTSALDAQREEKRRQVAELTRTRDELERSLGAASAALTHPPPSRLGQFFDSVVSNVIANVVTVPLLSLVGVIFGVRQFRAWRQRRAAANGSDQDSPPA